MESSYERAKKALQALANPERARLLQRYFKTGPGEYAEGDRFVGLTVPQVRALAREFRDLPLTELRWLIRSEIHEERLLALVILVSRYARGDEKERSAVFSFYVKNLRYINNWDLVDVSAPRIVGWHLESRSKTLLRKLARSRRLWDRRVAVLSTFYLIRNGHYELSLELAGKLLNDPEDLMHKAVGWMLREIGKKEVRALKRFLDQHCRRMPRTMLRYAIERLPPRQRKAYLKAR